MNEDLKAELRGQLRARLTTTDFIDDLLRLATGVRLFDEYATDRTPKNQVIKTLVDALDDEGTLFRFRQQVYRASPDKPELRAWLRDKFPAVDAVTEVAPCFEFQQHGSKPPPEQSVRGGLQR